MSETTQRGLTVGSLFAGIGGFDLGLERAGFRVLWAVENDDRAREVYRLRFPRTELYGDVRNVGTELPRVDVLVGGFPCQDVSMAGDRAGLGGERTALFWEFVRLARSLAPGWILLENVPGLLSSNRGRDMGTVLRAMGKLGYWWSYRMLDSQYFGVPQRRRRLFIVASPRGPRAGTVLHEPEGVQRNPPPRRREGKEVAGRSEGGARERGGLAYERGLANTVPTKWRGDPHEATDTLVVTTAFQSNLGTHARTGISTDLSPPILPASRTASPPAVVFDTTQITHPENRSRPRPGDPCHTLPANGYPPTLTYPGTGKLARRLTPVECERLQGFPDGWTAEGIDDAGERVELANTPRYRLIGNAVTVPVAEWIAHRILDHEHGPPPE